VATRYPLGGRLPSFTPLLICVIRPALSKPLAMVNPAG
jgi:hypothetical protein